MTIASFDLGGYLGARVRDARAGAGSDEWRLPCPRCGGREHLYVNADKRCGHCFRCGSSPGLLDLLADLEGLPRAEIARRIGAQDEASTLPALAALRQRVLGLGARPMQPRPFALPEMALPDAYVPLAVRPDATTERALAPFRTYLARRRIPPDAIASHRIGCALLGRYEGRVILPVLDGDIVVAYATRASCVSGSSASASRRRRTWSFRALGWKSPMRNSLISTELSPCRIASRPITRSIGSRSESVRIASHRRMSSPPTTRSCRPG